MVNTDKDILMFELWKIEYELFTCWVHDIKNRANEKNKILSKFPQLDARQKKDRANVFYFTKTKMFNKINWEKLNLANPEHVKIAVYLKNQSADMKKDGVLKSTCWSFRMMDKYHTYKKEAQWIKDTVVEYNKKEAKHKIDLIRDELIMECCIRIKEQIELWKITVTTEIQDYYQCTPEQMKKVKKL